MENSKLLNFGEVCQDRTLQKGCHTTVYYT